MGACLLRVACGVYFGTHTKVTPLDISSPHIQQEHKIIFISDLHVELIHNSAFIQSIVKQIKHINPDFVIIGGDLMNNAKAEYLSAFLPFNQLSMPIYATLGNHDHMGNA